MFERGDSRETSLPSQVGGGFLARKDEIAVACPQTDEGVGRAMRSIEALRAPDTSPLDPTGYREARSARYA